MPEPDLAHLAEYMVLVTDVLGQRSRLRELRDFPQSTDEWHRAKETLRETAGFVMFLRKEFKDCFDAWGPSSADFLKQFPADMRDCIVSAFSCDITCRHFSDSIVVAVCLSPDGSENRFPLRGALSALFAASHMHLKSLCLERPIRSGIDVGLAMLLPEGDVYGPALERAVHLEKCIAGYPRVAVGQRLTQYLANVASTEPIGPFAMVERNAARSCQRLIFEDVDGTLVLDFLGEEVYKYSVADPELIKLVPNAYRFVRAAQLRWHAQNDSKLAERYDMLWDYFRSRAQIWGAEIERLAEELGSAC